MVRTCFAAVAALAASAAIGPGLASGAVISPTTTTDQFGEDPGQCGLREAVQAANTDTPFGGCPAGNGADTIQLPDGSFVLSVPGDEDANAQGDLDTGGTLNIVHTGIQAATVNGGGVDRVFDLQGASSLTISGIAISGGVAASGTGGGIRNLAGSLTLANVTLSDNASSPGGNGGGVQNNGTALITNTTISGNRTANSGGGLRNTGTATLRDVTISANVANTDGAGGGDGGGISSDVPAAQNLIGNTIVAANGVGSGGLGPDCAGALGTAGHNLIGNTAGCDFNEITAPSLADVIDQNPLLGPLADNGGPTHTHALAPGSPALGRGGGLGCTGADQRGAPRSPAIGCDIGAYELVRCKEQIVNRVGTNGPDKLVGTEDADVFLLFAGNDSAFGSAGDDYFCGGAGNDRLRGEGGRDFGFGGSGRDRFNGGFGTDFASGGPGRDGLAGGDGGAKDRLAGNGGSDILNGSDGNDLLRGGGRNDSLRGGTGKDILKGGSGRDFCNGGRGKDRASSCRTAKRIP